MADAFLEWGDDFKVSPSGGLLLAYGDDVARQRIVRRLCTAVQGYVWHPDYGAGLPQKIGLVARPSVIAALVRSQIALEATVAANPAPSIKVTQAGNNPGAFVISIAYTDAGSGEPVTLQFTT